MTRRHASDASPASAEESTSHLGSASGAAAASSAAAASGAEPNQSQEPDSEQIRMTPWLVTLGIAALVLGLLTGLVMSQATLIR